MRPPAGCRRGRPILRRRVVRSRGWVDSSGSHGTSRTDCKWPFQVGAPGSWRRLDGYVEGPLSTLSGPSSPSSRPVESGACSRFVHRTVLSCPLYGVTPSRQAGGAVPVDTARIFPRHGGEGQGRRTQPRPHRLGFAPDQGIRLASRLLSPREPILRLSARPDPIGSAWGRVAIGRRRQVRSDGSFW